MTDITKHDILDFLLHVHYFCEKRVMKAIDNRIGSQRTVDLMNGAQATDEEYAVLKRIANRHNITRYVLEFPEEFKL